MITLADGLDAMSSGCAVDSEPAGKGDAVLPNVSCIIDVPLFSLLQVLGVVPVGIVSADERSIFSAGLFGGTGNDPLSVCYRMLC